MRVRGRYPQGRRRAFAQRKRGAVPGALAPSARPAGTRPKNGGEWRGERSAQEASRPCPAGSAPRQEAGLFRAGQTAAVAKHGDMHVADGPIMRGGPACGPIGGAFIGMLDVVVCSGTIDAMRKWHLGHWAETSALCLTAFSIAAIVALASSSAKGSAPFGKSFSSNEGLCR